MVSPAPDEDETLNSKWFELILKGLKLLAYIVTFGIVLGSAVVSKGSLLLMTSLIKPNRSGITVCNQGIPGTVWMMGQNLKYFQPLLRLIWFP